MPNSRLLLAVSCSISLLLAACASKDRMLPQDGKPMDQIYREHMEQGAQGQLDAARDALRRPLSEAEADVSPFVRTALTETRRQFRRLPNPDLVMFSFPHLATGDAVPVPGYSTVFPLYEKPEYALPGEPSE